MRDDYFIHVKANVFFTSSLWYWLKYQTSKSLSMTLVGWSLSKRTHAHFFEGG